MWMAVIAVRSTNKRASAWLSMVAQGRKTRQPRLQAGAVDPGLLTLGGLQTTIPTRMTMRQESSIDR